MDQANFSVKRQAPLRGVCLCQFLGAICWALSGGLFDVMQSLATQQTPGLQGPWVCPWREPRVQLWGRPARQWDVGLVLPSAPL